MTRTINVEGMTCMHCAKAVTMALEKLDGVTKAEVDLKKKTATIETNDDKLTNEMLSIAVENAGFKLK